MTYNDRYDEEPPEKPQWRFIRGDESDAGPESFISIGSVFPDILARLKIGYDIGDLCDSPIEIQLGIAIVRLFDQNRVGLSYQEQPLPLTKGLYFVPQFSWSYYRSDWAIVDSRIGAALLVECDGKAFHSSPAQIAHDAKKDAAALAAGFQTVRFTGSQILHDAAGCAAMVYGMVA